MFGFSQRNQGGQGPRPGGPAAPGGPGGPGVKPPFPEDSFDYRMFQIGMRMKEAAMKSRGGGKRVLGRRQQQIEQAQARVLPLLATRNPIAESELAYVLGAPPKALSEVLKHLEAAGVVACEPNPDDASDRVVALTEAGAARAQEYAEEAKRLDPMAALTEEEREQLFGLLDKVIAHLDALDRDAT